MSLLQHIDNILFNRWVAYPTLFGSSAGISFSLIFALFGYDTSAVAVICIFIMVVYFCSGIAITNAVRREARQNGNG